MRFAGIARTNGSLRCLRRNYESGSATVAISLDAATLVLSGGVSISAGGGTSVLEIIQPNGTARIGNLPNGASVLFLGGLGEDAFAMEYASAVLAGGIEFAGGDGINTVELDGAAARVKIGKLAPARFRPGGESIRFTGGTGNDTRNPIDADNDFPGGAPTGLGTFEVVEN